MGENMRIAVLIADEYEDSEYRKPADAFREAGHELVHVGLELGTVMGKHGDTCKIDRLISDVVEREFDALFIPGGHSPDNLRGDPDVLDFTQEFVESGKPTLLICHGPQILLSAGLVPGRRLTAWTTVQGDLQKAGADVQDEEVVEDGNLLSSRNPDDIPAFIKSSLKMLQRADEEMPTGERVEA